MGIYFNFHSELSGIYLHWNNDGSNCCSSYYPRPIEGFIFWHAEDGKVVEDFVYPVNSQNCKKVETIFKFPEGPEIILAHRKLSSKRIVKEQIFIADREPYYDYEKEYLWIRCDLVNVSEIYLKKHYLYHESKKPRVSCNRSNFEITRHCITDFGEFSHFVKFDVMEYTQIEQYYDKAIKRLKDEGIDGIEFYKKQILLIQIKIAELQDALERWENFPPEEILKERTMLLEDLDSSWGKLVFDRKIFEKGSEV